ncbi:MAG: hypothetical protein FWH11_05100 [Micrococcales bacterium]|nr:hypothetical protein [Micrococcales bacterium]
MSVTAGAVAGPAGGVPAREWYQVLGQWRAEWLARRPRLARRVAVTRTVVAWLALVYVAVLFVVQPDLRLGLRAWLGAVWVVVAWFFLARTKTLTFSGAVRFFAVCGVWSVVVAVLLDRVSSSRGMWGASGSGSATLVAGIGEEVLKLVPLVVLGLAAPRRVSRFSAADFALLGVAAGAAFEGVEEAIRRTAYMTSDGVFVQLDRFLYGDGLPPGWVHFGLWPVPTDWDDQGAGFGGHVVTTGVVAALAGLAVAAWRTVRRRHLVVRWAVRAVAVGVVLVGLVSVMADHVLYNAQGRASREVLLDPEVSALPWWVRVPWSALGHGQVLCVHQVKVQNSLTPHAPLGTSRHFGVTGSTLTILSVPYTKRCGREIM